MHVLMPAMTQTDFITLFLKGILALVLGLFLSTPVAGAMDWPQFRGPNRDGNWEETGVLESFPPNGLKICWRRPVGGGFSSPVVAQGRVFVPDVELIKPSPRERVHCFAEKTGKVLWVFGYKENYLEWTFVPERGAGPTGHADNRAKSGLRGWSIWLCALFGRENRRCYLGETHRAGLRSRGDVLPAFAFDRGLPADRIHRSQARRLCPRAG